MKAADRKTINEHKDVQRQAECFKKRKYELDNALDVINRARDQGVSLQKYPCHHCGWWHLSVNIGKRETL